MASWKRPGRPSLIKRTTGEDMNQSLAPLQQMIPPFISILLGTLGNHKRIAKPLVEARNGAPMTQWEISYFSGYLMIFWCFVVGSVGSVMSSSFGTLRTIIASYPPRCGSSLDNSWLHGRSEYSEFS